MTFYSNSKKQIFNHEPLLIFLRDNDLPPLAFCALFNLDFSVVDKFLNDKYYDISVGNLIEIANALSISIKDLIKG